MKHVDPPTDPENNIQPKDNPAINIQHKETDLLLGETAENKDEPKIQGAENVYWILMGIIILLIGGSASAYGLWINSKYNGNTNVACKNDLTWIKVFSIAVASSLVLIVASVPGPNDHPLTSCFGALASMTTIFLFIWQCYGLQVWFHQPICNVAEVHSFGLIFTWIFIVINSLLCLCACCAGCVALSMTG